MGGARYLLMVLTLVAVGCGGGESDADPRGATVTRFSLSAPGGGKLEQIAILPAQARENPPLLVLLHGRTDSTRGPDSMLSDALTKALERLGPRAPAVLLVNGGKSSYFHDRDSGEWGT